MQYLVCRNTGGLRLWHRKNLQAPKINLQRNTKWAKSERNSAWNLEVWDFICKLQIENCKFPCSLLLAFQAIVSIMRSHGHNKFSQESNRRRKTARCFQCPPQKGIEGLYKRNRSSHHSRQQKRGRGDALARIQGD